MTDASSPASSPAGSGPASASWSRTTRAIALGRPHGPGEPLNPPLVLSSTFQAGGPVTYAREGSPAFAPLEEVVADLEGAAGAAAFGAGIAAINAVLDLVPPGGTVLAPYRPYSGTRGRLDELHASGRIRRVEYDPVDTAATVAALADADLLWLESPTNPMLDVADLPALLAAARERGVRTAVDSTFLTPMLVRPLELGADLVVHSGTKYLAGHSDALLGIVAARDTELLDLIRIRRAVHGSTPGALEAWLTLRSLRTLPLRMERHVASAHALALRLTDHPRVVRVLYPGLPTHPGHDRAIAIGATGAVIGAVLTDDVDAEAVAERTRLWVHATSLGGVESLIERRARWWFEHPSLPPTLLRLSVGLEDVDDLWDDLCRAIEESVLPPA